MSAPAEEPAVELCVRRTRSTRQQQLRRSRRFFGTFYLAKPLRACSAHAAHFLFGADAASKNPGVAKAR